MQIGSGSPTQVLKTEHRLILKVIEALGNIVRAVEGGAEVPAERIRKIVEFSRTFIDRCHHGKEETCLFPCMERRGVPREGGPIGVMLMEHDQGRALVRQISDLVDSDVGTSERGRLMALCAEYVALLTQHISKEDHILFAVAEHVLSASDEAEILRGYDDIENVRMGPGVHEAMHRLADEVMVG
ncbi:MAG: hemerythrin domain-containing protein [Armatimonadota bacterium]|nr:hemerythrin domain-containing protein [Armatimonadota bacterium]MDR7518260.1 hemerythrin domain-containing protein [Armatimonadota bacterium]MDR7548684.1 hemerythrin domain-containing protein [Armatimonadota bacterium]